MACSIEHLKKQISTTSDGETLNNNIFGIEKKPLPHQLCTTNMILHGIDTPINIRRDNTLSKPINNISPTDRVDCIVTNPPFGGIEEEGIESNFPANFRTRETADLFLVYIMKMLKPQGRAGVVLPDGSLFGEGVKTRIKEELLKTCNLEVIVRLPNSVFKPYATVGTNLLFFKKGEPTQKIWFYEHRLPDGLKSYSKTNPIKTEEFDPIRKWWENKLENDVAWKVSIEDVINSNYNLDVKNPNHSEKIMLESSQDLMKKIRNNYNEINNLLDLIEAELKV